LALADEADLPEPLRALLMAMDGSETICIGEPLGCGFRAHRLRGAAALRALQETELAGDPAAFARRRNQLLEQPGGVPLWPCGEEGALAAKLAAKHRTVGGILRAYRRQAADNLQLAAAQLALAEHSPLAQAHGTRYPILQGPMTRVSDVAPFAA